MRTGVIKLGTHDSGVVQYQHFRDEVTTLQCSDQKKLNELKRIRGAMDCRESESKRSCMFKCAEVMEVNREENLQEVVDSIFADEGDVDMTAIAE